MKFGLAGTIMGVSPNDLDDVERCSVQALTAYMGHVSPLRFCEQRHVNANKAKHKRTTLV